MRSSEQKGEGALVSIVILNWNGLSDTLRCLESVRAQKYQGYEVIVVDNGSAGDDVALLRQRYGGDIQLIAHERNLGYAGGCNSAIRRVLAEGRSAFIWLLNNDAVVAPQCLEQLVRAMEDEGVAIAAPTIYYDGAGAPRVWYAGGRIDWWRGLRAISTRICWRAVAFCSCVCTGADGTG